MFKELIKNYVERNNVDIIANKYVEGDGETDFTNIIETTNDTLFIFNDNVQDSNTNKEGGGSCKIRPYNFLSTNKSVKAVGVSTGARPSPDGEWKDLIEGNDIYPIYKSFIDRDLLRIIKLIHL